ncbi:MAG TPA: hypothetical protein VKV17_17660, partial [Bryobacteraceae bacterium]|nr:hypothetical protein [Bryobacteraceae bacterium]
MAQCDLFTDWVRLPFLSLPSKSKSLAEGEFLFQLDPGSEFRVHRQWFDQAAMAELLETDFAVAAKDRMDRCLDRLLEHKEELFQHLRERWQDLFATHCDVLFYDLTSTYF